MHRSPRIEALAIAGAVALFALVSWALLGGGSLNYDTQWALNWGRGLLDGQAPDLETGSAPTSKPLVTVLGALAALVAGQDADGLLHALAHVGWAGLVVACGLLAAHIGGWRAGVVAALLVALLRPALLNTASGFQDASTAALVLWALLLELRRPGRGVAPLVVLAVAGLLRPEAWGLAVAYWVWQLPGRSIRERAALGLLALAGPVLWALSDLVLTGDPLLSFTRTRDGAEAAGRTTGLAEGPQELERILRESVEEPALAAALLAAAGVLAAALARRRGRLDPAWERFGTTPQLALVGLAALLTVAFLLLAGGELSLLPRYLIPLMAVLVVLAASFLTGWTDAPRGRARIAWAVVAAVLAAGTVALLPRQVDATRGELAAIRTEGDVTADLQDLVRGRAAGVLAGCRPATAFTYRVRPYLAYALERRGADVPLAFRAAELPPRAAWVVPASRPALNGFALLNRTDLTVEAPPASLRRVALTRNWAVLTRGC